MILRRYGSTVRSVELNFDARALTEIGFRREGGFALPVEEFEGAYRKEREVELAPRAEGSVQTETEEEVLAHLTDGIRAVESALAPDEVLLVESEQGVDFPKLRERREGIIVDGENRLHFHWWVDPPLRLGIYRKVGA